MLTDCVNDNCNIVGFEHVENLRMYLGMSLFHGRVGMHNFEFIVDKVRRKLNGWYATRLSMAGRIMLTKSVLLAIPNYFMGIVHLHVSICR